MCLVGCLPSHIQHALMEELLIILAFGMVLAYDLLEDRRTIDVTISFYAK